MQEMLEQFNSYAKFPAQMSLYKWLQNDPTIEPWGEIIFKLTDGGDFGKYPVDSMQRFPLFQTEEVEQFITDRTNLYDQHIDAGTLPECTKSEQGWSEGVYKLQRFSATTNKWRTVNGSICNNASDLAEFTRAKGRSGDRESITEPRQVLCGFCPHNTICDQFLGNS